MLFTNGVVNGKDSSLSAASHIQSLDTCAKHNSTAILKGGIESVTVRGQAGGWQL